MKKLLLKSTLRSALLGAILTLSVTIGGCETTGTGNAGGIGGTGIHGGVDATTTLDPNNPNDVKVTVGGHLNFAPRPLTVAEKAQIHQSAFDAGVAYVKSGVHDGNEAGSKANLIRRLSYRYRIARGQTAQSQKIYSDFKTLVNSSFEEGAKSAGEP